MNKLIKENKKGEEKVKPVMLNFTPGNEVHERVAKKIDKHRGVYAKGSFVIDFLDKNLD